MNFKIGDKVKIYRQVRSESEGWDNYWVTVMDQFVNNGKVYTIKRSAPGGLYLEGVPQIGWPPTALKYADQENEVTKEDIIARRIKKLWNESNWVKNNPSQAY